jgi:hypothetical protein
VREELRTSLGHKGFAQAIIGFGSHRATWTALPHAELPTGCEEEPPAAFPLRFNVD